MCVRVGVVLVLTECMHRDETVLFNGISHVVLVVINYQYLMNAVFMEARLIALVVNRFER